MIAVKVCARCLALSLSWEDTANRLTYAYAFLKAGGGERHYFERGVSRARAAVAAAELLIEAHLCASHGAVPR